MQMIEKRKFHRVKLSTRIILRQNNILHHGQLENISKSGALVRLEPDTYFSKESEYDVSVYLDGEETPLHFRAELVNITFGMAGIKFVAYDSETETRLDVLMELLSSEVDMAMVERKKYLRRLAEDFREG
jgi:hypothetical protein